MRPHDTTENDRVMNKITTAEMLQVIADDMSADARAFDGRPFNGRTVAEYMGNQGAAIAAIAGIVKALLLESLDDVGGQSK